MGPPIRDSAAVGSDDLPETSGEIALMDTWQQLERLATMASVLEARLSRAAEYGDDAEVHRIRIELMKSAEQRERVVARLSGEFDTGDVN